MGRESVGVGTGISEGRVIYLLSATARRAVEHAPAQLPLGWREVSHAEYMAAWATEDAVALAELRPRWQREADAAERARWCALPVVKGVEL